MNNRQCPNCSFQNAADMNFCSECGTNLSAIGSGGGDPSNFSGEPAPTVFSGAAAATNPFPTNPPHFTPAFSAAPPQPQKNSGVSKILLVVAAGGVLLILVIGVIGVAAFFSFYKAEPNNEISNVTDNRSIVSSTNSSTNNSSNSSSNNTRTIDNFVRSRIGGYSLTDTTVGNPASDGFSGAIEEKQYKYANSSGTFSIHYTVARYSSAAQAQQALRNMIDDYKRKGLNATEILTTSDNDGKLVGISSDLVAKNGLLSRFWTKNEFFIRALGEKKDVDSFFEAH